MTLTNQTGGTEQIDVAIPWSRSMTMKNGDFPYISAQKAGENGYLQCEIKVDGQVWKSAQANSAYGIATCNGWLGMDK